MCQIPMPSRCGCYLASNSEFAAAAAYSQLRNVLVLLLLLLLRGAHLCDVK
jgi:hypothetical protein